MLSILLLSLGKLVACLALAVERHIAKRTMINDLARQYKLTFQKYFSPGAQNTERQKNTLFPGFINNDKTAHLKT